MNLIVLKLILKHKQEMLITTFLACQFKQYCWATNKLILNTHTRKHSLHQAVQEC